MRFSFRKWSEPACTRPSKSASTCSALVHRQRQQGGGAYGRLETPSPACLRQGYGLLVPHRLPLAHFCVSSCALFCYVVPGCVPPCTPFPACLSTPGWQADLCSAIPDRQRQSRLLPDGEQAIRLCRMEIARHQAQMRKRPLRHLAAPLQSHLLEPACS